MVDKIASLTEEWIAVFFFIVSICSYNIVLQPLFVKRLGFSNQKGALHYSLFGVH